MEVHRNHSLQKEALYEDTGTKPRSCTSNGYAVPPVVVIVIALQSGMPSPTRKYSFSAVRKQRFMSPA